MKYILISIFPAIFFVTACKKKENLSKIDSVSETKIDNKRQMEWGKMLELIQRSKDGDFEAAYEIMIYHIYTTGDCPSAYFWACEAKRLGDARITDKILQNLIEGAYNILPSEREAKDEIILDANENILPSE